MNPHEVCLIVVNGLVCLQECYQVVVGGVGETTALLRERFDYIFYTGSTSVGKIIHKAANEYLTPITLELGGKSPVYIDGTVDMHKTVQRVLWGKVRMFDYN